MVRRLVESSDTPDAPIAAPAWLGAVLKLGVPSAIALYLVYALTQGISADVRHTNDLLQIHMTEQRILLRAICLNTSQTDAQRAGCIVSVDR